MPRERESILLVGLGGERALPGRILLLGFRARSAGDLAEAERIAWPGMRCVLVAARSLGPKPSLAGLVRIAGGEVAAVAVGPPPDADERSRLREIGFRLAIPEPFTDSRLRFTLNRACHGDESHRREAVRAPTDLTATIHGPTGEKPVLVYNLSRRGAFLESHRPSPPGARVDLSLPVGEAPGKVPVRVVHSNVTGNLERALLPKGMAVEFEDPSPRLVEAVDELVRRQLASLEL